MALPTSPTQPTSKSPRLLVIYGAPKVGKTTALSQLPKNLIVDLEEGTEFVSALKVNCNSALEYQNTCKEIVEDKTDNYDYVTIDTVSKLEEWCERVATNNYRASTIGKSFTGKSVLELPNGGGYLYLRTAFQQYLSMLSVGSVKRRRYIYCAHIRDKMLDTGNAGKPVEAKDLDLTGKIRSIVCSGADAIGYINRRMVGTESKLWISFKTTETVACGSRCDHLKGQEFEMDWKKIYID